MTEERSLPGWPKNKLIKEVRRHLSHYGIRPTEFETWQATWAWEAGRRSWPVTPKCKVREVDGQPTFGQTTMRRVAMGPMNSDNHHHKSPPFEMG